MIIEWKFNNSGIIKLKVYNIQYDVNQNTEYWNKKCFLWYYKMNRKHIKLISYQLKIPINVSKKFSINTFDPKGSVTDQIAYFV